MVKDPIPLRLGRFILQGIAGWLFFQDGFDEAG